MQTSCQCSPHHKPRSRAVARDGKYPAPDLEKADPYHLFKNDIAPSDDYLASISILVPRISNYSYTFNCKLPPSCL